MESAGREIGTEGGGLLFEQTANKPNVGRKKKCDFFIGVKFISHNFFGQTNVVAKQSKKL